MHNIWMFLFRTWGCFMYKTFSKDMVKLGDMQAKNR